MDKLRSELVKAEALIAAIEESAVLHKKLAEVSSRYLKRHFTIFKEEHSYFKEFLKEILSLLTEGKNKKVEYLLRSLLETEERLIKLAEETEEELE